MKTPRRSSKITQSKAGLNHVRAIVENAGCIFTKIDQEDDLGIDAIVELVVGEVPANRSFAVQIKSGTSYYDAEKKECIFPVGCHRLYWLHHPLPVLAIVHVPSIRTAFWFDLKSFLRADPAASTLRLPALRHREFSKTAFSKIFVPLHTTGRTTLSMKELTGYAESEISNERGFGIRHLFYSFPKDRRFWSILISNLRTMDFQQLTPALPFYLAHVPWHGDLGGDGSEPVSGPLEDELLKEFASFDKSEILKLLRFIDPAIGIVRGSMGQCVEAVVSAIDRFPEKLQSIVEDQSVDLQIREFAAFIHGMYRGTQSLFLFDQLAREGSSYFAELRHYVKESGRLNPYL